MADINKPLEFSKDSRFEPMRVGYNALAHLALNRATSSGGLAIGSSSKADVLVANTVNYIRGGVVRSGKTTAEVTLPAAASMPDDGTDRAVRVIITINASDAFAAHAGSVAPNGATPDYPEIPAGEVLVGHVLIEAAAGTAFVADTTLLDAAGITDTYSNEQVPSWLLDRVLRDGSAI